MQDLFEAIWQAIFDTSGSKHPARWLTFFGWLFALAGVGVLVAGLIGWGRPWCWAVAGMCVVTSAFFFWFASRQPSESDG